MPVRYLKKALAQVKISKIRNFGGKVADTFAELDITKIGQVQQFSACEIAHIFHNDVTKAKWIDSLCSGVCTEPVAEKGAPQSAAGMKTFPPITTWTQLEKNVTLATLDVNRKVQEYIEDWAIFPTQFTVQYRDIRENGEGKTQRHPFVELDDYQHDAKCFVTTVIGVVNPL